MHPFDKFSMQKMPKKANLKKVLVVSLHVLAYLDVEWYALEDYWKPSPIIVQEVHKGLPFLLNIFHRLHYRNPAKLMGS